MKKLLATRMILAALILCGTLISTSMMTAHAQTSAGVQTFEAPTMEARHILTIGEGIDGKPGASDADGRFNHPSDVAIGSDGAIYVADSVNNRIEKFDSNGAFITSWGGAGPGSGQTSSPVGVITDSSNHVFVIEYTGSRIQEFDSDGNYVLTFAKPPEGVPVLRLPYYGAIDSDGNWIVADYGNNRIVKFTQSGDTIAVSKIWTSFGNDEKFSRPLGVAIDHKTGSIYIASYDDSRVLKFDSDMNFIKAWGGAGAGNGQLSRPHDVAVDGEGRVLVADFQNHRISVFDSDGKFLFKWGSLGSEDGQFYNPIGLAVDKDDNIYVAEEANHRVQVFALEVLGTPPFSVSSALDQNTYTITGQPETSAKATAFTINPHQSITVSMEGQGALEMTLPKDMIDGINSITAGAQTINFEQVSSNSTHTTIQFSIPQNTRTIDIVGATVVPEFGVIAALVMAISIAVLVGYTRFTKNNWLGFGRT